MAQQKHGGRPPFAPPHGYMVQLQVFYVETCVTILKRGKHGRYTQFRQFWLSPDELPTFLKDWYELGADIALRRHRGRGEALVSVNGEGDVLQEAETSFPSTDSGGGDTNPPEQLAFDLW